MPKPNGRFGSDELARLGKEIFANQVRPQLRAEDDGKYVAIDAVTGNYEIDEDDWSAVARVHSRCPGAEVWLMRVGFPTAYQMRRGE